MDAVYDAALKYDPDIILKEKQLEAFSHLLKRKGDLLVNLPVGYGKSLIYHLLPDIFSSVLSLSFLPLVIVISPLNIIQKDQLRDLKRHGIPACKLNIRSSVAETTEDDDRDVNCSVPLEELTLEKFSILLCHPEALLNTQKGKELLQNENFIDKVVAVVVDECHIIEKWGNEFRTAFKKLGSLKAFFPKVPMVALSGTLNKEEKVSIPKLLCLEHYAIIESSPDRPNIFLEKIRKEPCEDVLGQYESIVYSICDELYEKKEEYPVTLVYIPIYYMSETLMYLNSLFGPCTIDNSLYSAICSGQDADVIDVTMSELKKSNPRIRLVLTTSIAGMGFDPENVTQIIHTCVPRNLSQYLQEIGRAGRRGQISKAQLYYSNRDIARNLPGMKSDMVDYCKSESTCLRNVLLSNFGFVKDNSLAGCKCCSHCKTVCSCEICR